MLKRSDYGGVGLKERKNIVGGELERKLKQE